eukprot:683293-Pyramimonas_sp.AAC.1
MVLHNTWAGWYYSAGHSRAGPGLSAALVRLQGTCEARREAQEQWAPLRLFGRARQAIASTLQKGSSSYNNYKCPPLPLRREATTRTHITSIERTMPHTGLVAHVKVTNKIDE